MGDVNKGNFDDDDDDGDTIFMSPLVNSSVDAREKGATIIQHQMFEEHNSIR